MASTVAGNSWKEEIREKLISLFEKDGESFVRIMWYLDEEDEAYKEQTQEAPAWKTLKAAMKADNAFKLYALRMADDTKSAENDPQFRLKMNMVYAQMMDASEESVAAEDLQGLELTKLTRLDMAQTTGCMGLARAWSRIPPASQLVIREAIARFGTSSAIQLFDDVTIAINKVGGKVVMVGLVALQLGYVAIVNIRRWWNGEISGKRCAKNVVDSAATLGAAAGGCYAGAMLGSMAGPIGTLAGGFLGGIVAGQGAQFLADWLTQKVFGVPKTEALENAYNYFGVKMTASNSEINSSYHKLCLEHHPDKGGRTEDFLIIQSHLAVIKMARE